MKTKTRNSIFCVIAAIGLMSCGKSFNCSQIIDVQWKYADGYYIGDVVQFQNKDCTSGKDIFIYRENKRVAKVLKANKQEMIIQSVEDSKTGRYVYFSLRLP